MLVVKKNDHRTSVDELFANMTHCFQRQYNREFGNIFEDKKKQLMLGNIKAMGLHFQEQLVGYLEYEVTQKDKASFYILYLVKGYRKPKIVSDFIKDSTLLLEKEGFKSFVAHLSPLRYIPIKKAMEIANFKKKLRYEMRLSLKYQNVCLKQLIVPFSEMFSNQLKGIMRKAFKDSVDYKIYSEFFTAPGQDKMLEKIMQGDYGPFLKNCSPLMFSEGKIIGYGLVTAKDSETSFLMDFAIDPEYQNSGMGKGLLGIIINLLIDSGFRYLNLAVTYENSRAYKLYKKAGFKTVGKFEVFMYNSNIY